MSTFIGLPKELLHILSYLPLLSIENLAKTHNYEITPTCLPLIQPLITRRRHIANLTTRFGHFHITQALNYDSFMEDAELFGIMASDKEDMSELNSMQVLQALEHLVHHFTGDLKWLEAVPIQNSPTRQGTSIEKDYNTLTFAEMSALEAEARALGLTLPPAFVKLFTNAEIMQHVPAVDETTLRLSGLRKVPAAMDKGAGEYCITMREEARGCWSLYLFPDGTHCVLETPYEAPSFWIDMDEERYADLYQTTADEQEWARKEGREMANVSTTNNLEGVGFEEWLYILCCEHGIKLACWDGEDVGEGLREYVKTIYVEGNECFPKSVHYSSDHHHEFEYPRAAHVA